MLFERFELAANLTLLPYVVYAEIMLTKEQRQWAMDFVECGNAERAYKAVYHNQIAEGTDVATQAMALKQNGMVMAFVLDLQLLAAKEILFSKNSVLQEYARIGTSDVRRIADEHGYPKRLQDLDDDTARAIASYRTKQTKYGEEIEYKFWPKLPALEALAKRLGIFLEEQSIGETYDVAVTVRKKVE